MGAVLCQDAAHQLGVVGEVLHKEVQHATAGAHGPVPGAVEHPADAVVDDGPGMHSASKITHSASIYNTDCSIHAIMRVERGLPLS